MIPDLDEVTGTILGGDRAKSFILCLVELL